MISRRSTKLLIAIALVSLIIGVGNFSLLHQTPASPTKNKIQLGLKSNQINQLISALPTPNSVNVPAALAADKPTIYAKSYIVMNNTNKYPLLAQNEDTPVAIASTTKVMTAILALENYDLNQVITIPPSANSVEGSVVDFQVGEKLTVKDVLYALLLNSANNAAVALAQANGQSVDSFVAKMNAKAKELGLTNTHYQDPAGLDDDNGHSTPRDLAILFDYAMQKPEFRTIAGTPQYTIWSVDHEYRHDLNNSNRLISPEQPLYLPTAIGGKTGFTYTAGHCIIVEAEANNKRYVAVILNTIEDTNDASAKEVRKLLVWAIQNDH